MMKTVKRFTAIAVSIAVFAATLIVTTVQPALATDSRFILDFDSNSTGLFNYYSGLPGELVEDTGGNHVYKITGSANYTVGGFKTTYQLEKDTKYTVTFKYKNPGAGFCDFSPCAVKESSTGYTFFRDAGKGNNPSQNSLIDPANISLSSGSSDWKVASFEIDTTGSYVSDTLKYFSLAYRTWGTSSVYEFYIDDISIVPVQKQNSAVYDFEDDNDTSNDILGHWSSISGAYVQESEINRVFKVSGSANYGVGGFKFPFQLEKEKRYTVTFKYKNLGAGFCDFSPCAVKESSTGYTFFRDAGKGNNPSQNSLIDPANISLSSGSSDWKVASFEIDTTGSYVSDTLKYFSLAYRTWGTSSVYEFYIDDVIITEKKQSDEIVANGSFENDISALDWSDREGVAQRVNTDKVHGSNSLKISGGRYSVVSQIIFVEANKNYEISFFYKGTSVGIPNWAVTMEKTVIESPYVLAKGTFENSNEWKKVSVVFSSGENNILNVLFQTTAGCEYYIDNVVVEETDKQPETVTEEPVAPKLLNNLIRQTRFNAKDGTNLITNAKFEETSAGNWNTLTAQNTMSVISMDGPVSIGGNNVLKYQNYTGERSWSYCYLTVEPDTEYYFTTWVKGENYNGTTNKNDLYFGIADADNGKFITPSSTSKIYTSSRQLIVPSYDNEWHLITTNFNTGSANKIAVAVSGSAVTAYFDDMQVFKASDAERYLSAYERIEHAGFVRYNNGSNVVNDCAENNNLFANAQLSDSVDEFWKTGINFGISDVKSIYGNFVEISDTKSTKGKALHYIENSAITGYPLGTCYYMWVNVEPNTEYTFVSDYQIVKAGGGSFSIINDNSYYPTKLATYSFDADSFDEDYSWKKANFTFNSNENTRVAFLLVDAGGEAYIDNLKLFKTADGFRSDEATLPENIISNKYEITDNVISGISEGTTIKAVVDTLSYQEFVKVFDRNGNEITDYSKAIGSGVQIRYMDGIAIAAKADVNIAGDIDGDGYSNTADLKLLLKYRTKQVELDDVTAAIADLDEDGEVTINDCAVLSNHLTGIKKLS